MKITGKKFHETFYDRLNDCVYDSNDTEYAVSYVATEFTLSEINNVLFALIEDRKKLISKIKDND